jgi:hypothetical protein
MLEDVKSQLGHSTIELTSNAVGDRIATVVVWSVRSQISQVRRPEEPRVRELVHGGDEAGAPCTIGDQRIEAVIVNTLEAKPADATHWSTRSMGMSQSSISRIWRAFGLQHQGAQSFRLSTDPLFIEKVRDVVGLYLNPPEKAMVLCVDEKSQIQALDRSEPSLPMLIAIPERRSHDSVRHGTSSLFAGLDTLTGRVIGALHRRHRASEFKAFLEPVDGEVPGELAVHLVLDNYATHNTRDPALAAG